MSLSAENHNAAPSEPQKSSRISARTIGDIVLVGAISALASGLYYEITTRSEKNALLQAEITLNRDTIKDLTKKSRDLEKHESEEFQNLERRKAEYETALKNPWGLHKNKDEAVGRFRLMTSQCGNLLISHALLLSKNPEFQGQLHMLWLDMRSRLIDLERDIRRPEPDLNFFPPDKGRKVHAPSRIPQIAHSAAPTPRYMQRKRSA